MLLLVEHTLLRQGLCRLIRETSPVSVVTEAESTEEALRVIRVTRPDVVLLHIIDPAGRGIRVLRHLREQAPDLPVVLLLDSVSDDAMVAAIQAGAAGCLDKSVDAQHLVEALQDAASGEIALSESFARRVARMLGASRQNGARQLYLNPVTQREAEVLGLLAQGLTNREIARALFVSESTVRAHLRTVTQKLGVHNRVHAVARALQLGMVPIAEPAEEATSPSQLGQKLASLSFLLLASLSAVAAGWAGLSPGT